MSTEQRPSTWQQFWPPMGVALIILLLTWVGGTYVTMADKLTALHSEVAILRVEVRHLTRRIDQLEAKPLPPSDDIYTETTLAR